ncbi:hypothetical protein MRX96_005839 [Rhipicephalus microplus]
MAAEQVFSGQQWPLKLQAATESAHGKDKGCPTTSRTATQTKSDWGAPADGTVDLASGNMSSRVRSEEWRTRLRNHDADRPYKCRMCPRSFTQSSHLKRHCLSHTGQLPFKCNFCGKRFARSDNCRTHEKSHMRAIGRL